jgi:hypothetical protein
MIVTARILLVVGLASGVALRVALSAQSPRPAQAPAPEARPGPAEPLYKLDDAFLRWPLAGADASYGAIDGRRL